MGKAKSKGSQISKESGEKSKESIENQQRRR